MNLFATLFNIVELIVLFPLAFIMLIERFIHCYCGLIITILSDYIIPSPKRWYMFLFQFIEPYAGYKVDEYGNYYELKYALVVKRKIKKEVLQDLKYAYTFIMLFVLFLSWTLKSVNYGLIIVAFIYWNNSQLFLQKGEEWKRMVY